MDQFLTYEQPLNERVRNFLRIEHLFNQVNHYKSGENEYDYRGAISTLLEIANFISRSDIKTELIKELERHVTTLSALEKKSGVDQQRLHDILEQISNYLVTLRGGGCQPGLALRQDELLLSIKQRYQIPGGSCSFDLPGYFYWLNNTISSREKKLAEWQDDLMVVKDSIKLSLNMIRNSTNPISETAEQGFFKKSMDSSTACQLIRVILPSDSGYYPEISGGRHRFTVRFMEQQSTEKRPIQTTDNVQFELHCCIL